VGPNVWSEDIRTRRRCRESAGLIVVWKRGNARGAKRPYCTDAEARRGESRLGQKDHTTEDADVNPDRVPEWGDRRKCPEKLSLLRLGFNK
jgi:hypothetical protein